MNGRPTVMLVQWFWLLHETMKVVGCHSVEPNTSGMYLQYISADMT